MKIIDINSVLDTMKKIFSKTIPEVAEAVDGYIADSKERLKNLAEGAISGELSYAFVTKRLKEEAVTMKNYLLSLGQIVAAGVEEKVNEAIDLFESEIKAAIPDSIEE